MFTLFLILFLIEGPGWTVKIEPIQYEYYAKEPMWFKIEALNNTERELKGPGEEGFIEMDGERCGKLWQRQSLDALLKNPSIREEQKVYPPKSLKKMYFMLIEVCYGELERLWARAEVGLAVYGAHRLCYVRKWKEYSREIYKWEDKEERFCTEFKISYPPEGEERQFYNKYLKERAIDDISRLEEDKTLKAIEEFPSAWYAGWILTIYFRNFAILEPEYFLKEIKKPMEERDFYKSEKTFPSKKGVDFKKKLEIYALKGEEFLKRHKNHPLKALIYASLSYEYFYLGDKEKGIEYGEKALREEYPEWYILFNYDPTGEVIKFQKENLRKIIEEIKKTN